LRRVLGVKEDASEFRVVHGSMPAEDEEIALPTRSITDTCRRACAAYLEGKGYTVK
jgi:hypothetical protein